MHVKKKMAIVVIFLVVYIFILYERDGETNYFRTHPAKAFVENEQKIKTRCEVFSENNYFCSYSVYGNLTEEDLENIAEYVYLKVGGEGYKDGGANQGALNIEKYSFAFYKNDTEEALCRFMYKDGKRLKKSDKDEFIPGDFFMKDFESPKENQEERNTDSPSGNTL